MQDTSETLDLYVGLILQTVPSVQPHRFSPKQLISNNVIESRSFKKSSFEILISTAGNNLFLHKYNIFIQVTKSIIYAEQKVHLRPQQGGGGQ